MNLHCYDSFHCKLVKVFSFMPDQNVYRASWGIARGEIAVVANFVTMRVTVVKSVGAGWYATETQSVKMVDAAALSAEAFAWVVTLGLSQVKIVGVRELSDDRRKLALRHLDGITELSEGSNG